MIIFGFLRFIYYIFVRRQVSGITLIITAAVIQGVYSKSLDFLGNEFLSAPMLFIIVGVVIFLVAFFGCCGAIKENNCMMITVWYLFFIIYTTTDLWPIFIYLFVVFDIFGSHLHLRNCRWNCCLRLAQWRRYSSYWKYEQGTEPVQRHRPWWSYWYLEHYATWGDNYNLKIL